MKLFFTIHSPHHLKSLSWQKQISVPDAANTEGFQDFVNRRFFPWMKAVQHLLRIEGFTLQISVSGTVLEQMEAFAPDALQALKSIAANRNVHFVETTYYHSICTLFLGEETEEQIQLHKEKIEEVFGKATDPMKPPAQINLPETVLALAKKICSWEQSVKATKDKELLHLWRLLQDRSHYSTTHEALLKMQVHNLEVLLLQRKLSTIRIRYPQHSFLL